MVNGIRTLAYQGVSAANPPNLLTADRAPSSADIFFDIGTIWVDSTTNAVYMLTDLDNKVATWTVLGAGTQGLLKLAGNIGTATEDANTGTIHVPGFGTNIITTGVADTLTIALNDVITVDGILLPDTTATGAEGFIKFGGDFFITNYGTHNTFIGENSGNAILTVIDATENSGLGYNTLSNLTTGTRNTALGSIALTSNTAGDNNTAIGYAALTLSTISSKSTAVGATALASADGESNIGIGYRSGINYTGGESSNIVIGNEGVASESNVLRIGTDGVGDGQINSACIAGIWNRNIDATNQVVLIDANGQLGTGPGGTATFDNINLPNSDPAVPEGYINFGGNRFINNYGTNNTFVGQDSGNTTLTPGSAEANTGIGADALLGLTTGDRNTCVGLGSGASIGSGFGNTFIGADVANGVLGTLTGSFNVGISGIENNPMFALLTSGSNNVAIGQSSANIASLHQLLTGSWNIAINGGENYVGAESSNICIGAAGLPAESNTMRLGTNGSGVGEINQTYIAGNITTAQGITAATGAISTINGSIITISSTNAATNNSFVTIKNRNGAIVQNGDSLGSIAFKGFDGVADIPGARIVADVFGAPGVNNMPAFLDFYTNPGTATPLSRMTIGTDGTVSFAGVDTAPTTSPTLFLTQGTIQAFDMYGLTVGGTNSPVIIDNTGLMGTISSSARYKDDIMDMGMDSEQIMQLRPVTFTYKKDPTKYKRWGLIAEEVHEVFPDIVNYDDEGRPDNVRYHDLPCILLNEIQKQRIIIDDLLKRITTLEESTAIN